MAFKKIIIGADHGAFHLKHHLVQYLKETGMAVSDLGAFDLDPEDDYPDFSEKVCRAVLEDQTAAGVLLCGSGIGTSIAANKVPGIRCALCTDVTMARLSRAHNNANVIAFGERLIGTKIAEEMVDIFIETPFDGGRHQRRIDKIAALKRSFKDNR